ncbi:hypothetical protein K523DRAFT_95946, partial [Schizophyllum commune Tattone D]
NDELKVLFAAADQVVKATSSQEPKNVSPGLTTKGAPRSQNPETPPPPKTLPRDELPPLSVPLTKNTFTPMYRLGWMYTLRVHRPDHEDRGYQSNVCVRDKRAEAISSQVSTLTAACIHSQWHQTLYHSLYRDICPRTQPRQRSQARAGGCSQRHPDEDPEWHIQA